MAKAKRTPGQVIDQAIQENRPGEYVCYFLTVLFAGSGAAALLYGAIQNQGVIALAGGIGGALFWPALKQAREIRRESICVRLLEASLNHAGTAEEAARVLRDFFAREFVEHSEPQLKLQPGDTSATQPEAP